MAGKIVLVFGLSQVGLSVHLGGDHLSVGYADTRINTQPDKSRTSLSHERNSTGNSVFLEQHQSDFQQPYGNKCSNDSYSGSPRSPHGEDGERTIPRFDQHNMKFSMSYSECYDYTDGLATRVGSEEVLSFHPNMSPVLNRDDVVPKPKFQKIRARQLHAQFQANQKELAKKQWQLAALKQQHQSCTLVQEDDLLDPLLVKVEQPIASAQEQFDKCFGRATVVVCIVAVSVGVLIVVGSLFGVWGEDDDGPTVCPSILVDQFSSVSDCWIVDGDVSIDSKFQGHLDIAACFPNLVEVQGSFNVTNVDRLVSLSFGTGSLQHLGGTLILENNLALTNISMLGRETIGSFEIASCPQLEEICFTDDNQCFSPDELAVAVENNATTICHQVLFEDEQLYRSENPVCQVYDRNCRCL